MTKQTGNTSKRRYAREPKTADTAPRESHATIAPPPNEPRAQTKISRVIVMLQGEDGTTLDQMMEATGWQKHTTRAALTGLKKKGHTIEREKREGTSVYRITAIPA